MTKMVRVTGERTVNTCVSLSIASRHYLDRACAKEDGSFYDVMGSLLFSAFTLEAYLNHLGSMTIGHWDYLERLRPQEKLELLSNILDYKIDYSKRPFQTINILFNFRNEVAHGKTETVKVDKVVKLSQRDSIKDPQTKWEKYCTLTNAQKANKDVGDIVSILHKKADIEGPSLALFSTGGSTTTAL